MQRHVLIPGALLLGAFILGSSLASQTAQEPSLQQAESLKAFLQRYLGKPDPGFKQVSPTRYSSAFVDLNDDGTKEVIAYITGRDWCGTGGCTMLILIPEGGSYKAITRVPAVRLPVRMLATKSNAWHDISVVARINGTEPLYEAILSFDGKSYPNQCLRGVSSGKAQGRIVMRVTAKDEPLY